MTIADNGEIDRGILAGLETSTDPFNCTASFRMLAGVQG